MWSLLRTRRWLGFTALVIVSIIAFGLLSLWQWHRAEDKRGQRIELQNALAATPVDIGDVILTDGSFEDVDQWRHVTASGTYLPNTQILVRKRPLDAHNGFWVMTAMQMSGGGATWVNRGWVPTGGDALSTPDVQPPPSGTVEVTGYLRPFEEADASANDGLPTGQIAAPAAVLLPDVDREFNGYLQLQESVPTEEALVPLPLPDVDESRNISYAVQWLLFAFVAMGGWFFFLRREAIDDTRRAAKQEAEA